MHSPIKSTSGSKNVSNIIVLYSYTTESSEETCRVAPVVLTEDNISEFQVTDLVLPLPGYDVQYPDNEMASWYRELLAADGFEDFTFRNRVKLVRRFVTRVSSLQIVGYI